MVLYLTVGDWLRSPPGWLVAILLAFLVAHLLKLILDILDRTRDNTLNALEIIVTLCLIAATFHQAYENSVREHHQLGWFEQPLVFIGALVFFGLLSGILIIVHRYFSV